MLLRVSLTVTFHASRCGCEIYFISILTALYAMRISRASQLLSIVREIIHKRYLKLPCVRICLQSCQKRLAALIEPSDKNQGYWSAIHSKIKRPSNFCGSTLNQGCGVGAGVGFLTTLRAGVKFFVRVRLRMSNWIIFYITLLHSEFLLKWYNFFWNFCWNRASCYAPRFPLILTAKFHSLYVIESESEILERSELESDILRPTPQPCFELNY